MKPSLVAVMQCRSLCFFAVNLQLLSSLALPLSSQPLDIPLIDQQGKPRSLAQFKGKTVVLNFIFTNCTSVCPLQTRQLMAVQTELDPALRSQVQFVSVSVDPERDTPQALASFARRYGADLTNWSFLTGSKPNVTILAQTMGVLREQETISQIPDHRAFVLLLNAQGKLMQRYSGASVDRPRLVREIQQVALLFNNR
jgi:protein SCO1